MKLLTIVTPCFNEEDNVLEVYQRVKDIVGGIDDLEYEHLFIDNRSTDLTQKILRDLAERDPRVKVIFNSRNFGPLRSPYYALLQAKGDAAVLLVADLQDPPDMIIEFVEKWRGGSKIVAAVKPTAEENALMFLLRRIYYSIITRIADIPLVKNFTGFGLYDRVVLEELRLIDDPDPYLRGLVCELGFDIDRVEYNQPTRKHGRSKFNLYSLFDVAMLGITSHSKLPLRILTIAGFAISVLSLLVSIIYLALKFIFWSSFPMGTAPLLIGIFFFASVQLFFIGVLGEYVGAILTQVKKRPLVIESERINY